MLCFLVVHKWDFIVATAYNVQKGKKNGYTLFCSTCTFSVLTQESTVAQGNYLGLS